MSNELKVRITGDGSQLKTELANATLSVRQFGNTGVAAGEQISTGFTRTRAGLTSISEQLSRTRQELIGFFSVQYAAGMVGDLITVADNMARVDASLRMATDSQSAYTSASAELFNIAQQNQAPLAETVTLFSRLAPAIKEAGGNQAQALGITQAFSDALKVGNATTAESASAMMQFSQAMASGVLRGDEFNSINEALPRIMRALADGLGVPTGALRTMAEQGQLTSDVIGNALMSQMVDLREEAAAMPKTIGGAMTEIRNEFARTISEFDRSTGTSSTMASLLSNIAHNMDDVAAAGILLSGVFAGRLTGAMAVYAVAQARAITVSLEHRAAAVQEARALEENHRRLVALNAAHMGLSASVRAQVAQSSVATGAATTYAASLNGLTRAAGLASGALSLLGGPLGAIMFAVSAATAWAVSSDDAADKTENWSNRLKELKGDLKAVKVQQLTSQIFEAQQRIDELSRAQSAWTVMGELISGKKSQARIAAEKELDDVRAFVRGAQVELERLKTQKDDQLPSRPGKTTAKPNQPSTVRGGQAAVGDYYAAMDVAINSTYPDLDLQREQAKAWADAWSAAYATTRTPMEEYNARLLEAQNLRAASIARGMSPETANDLFNRQTLELQNKRVEADPEVAQQRSNMQAFLGLQESLTSQNDLIDQQYAQRAEIIRAYSMQEYADMEAAQSAMSQLTLQHLAQRGDIESQAALARADFEKKTTTAKTQFALGQMVAMTAGAARNNKTMFQLNKAAAIAEASISLVKGTIMTWGSYPYPWNIPMTALYVAGGLAHLNQLKSSQFGGGGTPSVGGGSVGTFPASPATGLPTQRFDDVTNKKPESAQQITIIVNGNLVDMTQLARDLRPYNIELAKDTI